MHERLGMISRGPRPRGIIAAGLLAVALLLVTVLVVDARTSVDPAIPAPRLAEQLIVLRTDSGLVAASTRVPNLESNLYDTAYGHSALRARERGTADVAAALPRPRPAALASMADRGAAESPLWTVRYACMASAQDGTLIERTLDQRTVQDAERQARRLLRALAREGADAAEAVREGDRAEDPASRLTSAAASVEVLRCLGAQPPEDAARFRWAVDLTRGNAAVVSDLITELDESAPGRVALDLDEAFVGQALARLPDDRPCRSLEALHAAGLVQLEQIGVVQGLERHHEDLLECVTAEGLGSRDPQVLAAAVRAASMLSGSRGVAELEPALDRLRARLRPDGTVAPDPRRIGSLRATWDAATALNAAGDVPPTWLVEGVRAAARDPDLVDGDVAVAGAICVELRIDCGGTATAARRFAAALDPPEVLDVANHRSY